MTRLLPLSSLLLLALPALAQQPDTLSPRRVGVAATTDDLPIFQNTLSNDTLYHRVEGILIETIPLPSPFLPLQEQLRRVAGVQASPYSGAPGAQVAVRLRGAASLARNAQPLYVVDGVPVYQNMGESELQTTYGVQQVQVYGLNPLLNLPNEDVESVTVLRGAYETAAYGAQGQNGVISITTKLGRLNQAPQVRYSGYGGVQQVRRRYDLLNARQYAEFQNEAARNTGFPEPFSPIQVAGLGEGTDWQQEVLRVAALQEHHLSVSGGRPTTRYYVGADHLRQNGIVENSQLRRYALRANMQQQLTPRLTLDARAGASQSEARLPPESLTLNMLTAAPVFPARLPDGELNDNPRFGVNPLSQALRQTREPRQRQLLARLELRQQLGQHFTASLLGHAEWNHLLRTGFNRGSGVFADYEDRRNDLRQMRQLTYRTALDYSRTLAGRHALTAHLEVRHHNVQQYDSTDTRLSNNSGQSISYSVSQFNSNLLTATLQTGYTYADRYELQASLRRDGSSAFGTDQRWQWSPGAQLTWHAGQEAFLKDNSIVSQLDVRAGVGRTSNAGYLYGQNFFALFQTGAGGLGIQTLSILGVTTQQDAGLSVGLWDNKLMVEAGAYQRRTALSTIALFGRSDEAGTLRARGLELSLTGTWLSGPRWRAGTTLALAAQQSRYYGNVGWGNNNVQLTADGEPLATYRGLRYLGPDATGQPRYAGSTGASPEGTYENLGSGLPTRLLGFTQDLRYQRLRLQLQADGAFGHQVYSLAGRYLDDPAFYANGRRLLDRWTPANPNTDVPAAGAGLRSNSSYFLQSGNHVRLSSLQVSYELWKQAARSVSVWAGGQNLLVLTKYRGFDPSVSSAGADANQAGLDASAYPTARTLLLGVQGEF
ncbi:SusC/RagA family TonB-linked outer membrane protein [Hymenobacter canadensis]|uniref:SusC/RagA family TonB-linked outer membrane protein n=1 Tax=Hymenobacter canadensis TaxID=2999067 RepID=A0ABY7LK87_9BACT|nr:SusC/RagA family TonB-linked outer membrane protein [Hymenobacter canadensis]WBA40848.1 SusC/RagA family TonB-linked outer membrane protein [Hymenobacter canadensis]